MLERLEISRRTLFASAAFSAEYLLAQTQPSPARPTDNEVVQAFLTWDRQSTQPGLGLSLYISKLRADRVPQEEIDRRVAVIRRVLGQKEIRNLQIRREYNSPGNATFRVTPTEWLAQVVADLKPAKALDVGMGSGRNSLFLARKGWEVTGVDLSDVAVEQARTEALGAGVRYTAVAADLEQFDFGRNRWDLIILIFTPDRWSEKICEGLRPGGVFVREQYAVAVKGQDVEERKRAVGKLYPQLVITRYEEVLDPRHYAPSDDEAARARATPTKVTRIVATKT